MDNKVIIVIAAVAIVAIAAVAFVFMSGDSSEDVPSDSVRYKGNGGETDSGLKQYDSKTTSVMDCIFVRDGYHFVTWNDKANGSGANHDVGSQVPLKSVLYAQWSDSNVLASINMHTDVFSLYVAQKGQSDMINIDQKGADLASKDAILVVVPASKTAQVSIDDQNRVVITDGKDTYIVGFSIEVQGITLGNAEPLGTTNPAIYYDIGQNVKNKQAFLGIQFLKKT